MTIHPSRASTGPAKSNGAKVGVAVGIGNFMEWFDFAIYGFFAISIGKTFFPSDNPVTSLLSTLAVYGVAFLMRPVGGLFFGLLADRRGRRISLAVAVVMMGVSTALMAVLPSYASIGVAAPILLVLLRCGQGFSAGGEWTGSATFGVESASTTKRALMASIIPGTAALAVSFGAIVAVIVSTNTTTAQVDSWGWRLPFLLALPLTLIGLYMRIRLEETPVFQGLQELDEVEDAPLRAASRIRPLGIAFALSCVTVLGFYYLATYTPTFLISTVQMPRPSALSAVAIGAFLYAACCPLAGLAAERFGRRKMSLIGSGGLALFSIPAFWLMGHGTVVFAVAGIVLFGIFEALHNVSTTVMLVELFPAGSRVTSAAIGYNLGAALVAGPGPLIAAALAAASGGGVLPASYMAAIAVIVTIAMFIWLPETRGVDIADGAFRSPGNEQPELAGRRNR